MSEEGKMFLGVCVTVVISCICVTVAEVFGR